MVTRAPDQPYEAGIAWAGLLTGPIAWILSLQAKYSLVPWECAHQFPMIHVVTIVTILIGLAGGYLSWRALATLVPEPPDRSGGGRPHKFVAVMGLLSAALFTFLIVLQGSAALVFNGCER